MPAPARKPGRKPGPASVIKRMFFFTMCCSIGAAGFRPRSRAHDAGLSPCARNTIREAISLDMSRSTRDRAVWRSVLHAGCSTCPD